MTHTESCITVALMAIHLFGLGDRHSFTTRQRTQTRTHGHARTEVSTLEAAWDWAGGTGLAVACLGLGTGRAGVPMLPRGGGLLTGQVPSLVTRRCPSLGEGWHEGAKQGPAPHRLVRANHLKHFLDVPWRMKPGAGFLPREGANPSSPPCSLQSPWDPHVVPGRLGSGASSPRAFPAHDPWHGRQSVGP